MVNDVDEENEEDGDDDDDDEEDDSWTPKRRSPPRVKDVHVLQLCPILPQCEHFLLPIMCICLFL